MTPMTLLMFVAGLVMLIAGAEFLVNGASKLAAAFGVSPLVIGLTVVAFGTSAPELAVSMKASIQGNPDLAVGNVVGSNIANILLIIGVAALATPLTVSRKLLRQDLPFMIGVSMVFAVLALDGKLGRLDGVLLFGLLIGFIGWSMKTRTQGGSDNPTADIPEIDEEDLKKPGSTPKNLVMLIGGLSILTLGSNWLVESASQFARALGVSDLVIGLTIVAGGTSLPEAATSVMASVRGERDLAVGNAVGSNIFNLLCVLGITSLIAPQGVPVSAQAIGFDIPIMLIVAFSCMPIFYTHWGKITRGEGGIYVFFYLGYTTYLVLHATESTILPVFTQLMVFAIIPVVALLISYSAWFTYSRDDPDAAK